MASVQDAIIDTPPVPEVAKLPPNQSKEPSPHGKKSKSQLPPSPTGTETVGAADLFAYTRKLEQRHWDRINAYLYQLVPVIRRKPSHIAKLTGPIDEEWILSRHGSGRYHIKLNDADGAGTIIKSTFELNDPERPNKFNIHELDLKASDNRQLIEELKREGKLTQEGDVIAVKTPENADATMAEVVKTIALKAMENRQNGKPDTDEEKKLSAILVEWALKQTANDKQEGSTGKLAELVKAIKDLMPAPAAPVAAVSPMAILAEAKALFAPVKNSDGDPMITLLMQELKSAREEGSKERQRNHDLQMKMMETKAEAADPMEMVEKVLNIQEKLGGGGEPRNWKEKLVDQGFAALPDILTAVKGYAQRQPPPVQRPQQQTQQPQPTQTIQTQSAAPAQPQGETVTQPADPDIAFLLPILESQGRRFVTAFKNDPLSGGEVARSVILYADNATYERIARMGRMKILATIDLLPEMKADLLKVGTQQMLDEFIDDFVAGPEDPDEDDGDDDNDDDGDNGEQEPGFADPANPEERAPLFGKEQPPRTGKLGPVPTAHPKHKKKVTA